MQVVTPSPNLARIDLVSLNLVVQCAQHGSISAAAQHCHLSLMGASSRLARLEQSLGRRLFDRHHRGLAPTEAGEVVLKAASEIVEAARRMTVDVRRAAEPAPTFRPNPGRRGSGVALMAG